MKAARGNAPNRFLKPNELVEHVREVLAVVSLSDQAEEICRTYRFDQQEVNEYVARIIEETRPSTVPGTWQDVQSKRTRKEEEKKRKSTLKSSSRPPRDKDGQRPSRDGQQKRDKDGSLKSSSVVADGTTTSLPSPPPVATRPSTTGATPRVPRKRTVVVVRSNGAAVPTAATPAPAPAKPSPPPKPAVIAHGAWANGVIFHKPTQPEAAPVIDLTGLVLKTAAAVAAGQPSATPAVAPAAAAANPGVVVVKTSLQPRPTQPNGQTTLVSRRQVQQQQQQQAQQQAPPQQQPAQPQPAAPAAQDLSSVQQPLLAIPVTVASAPVVVQTVSSQEQQASAKDNKRGARQAQPRPGRGVIVVKPYVAPTSDASHQTVSAAADQASAIVVATPQPQPQPISPPEPVVVQAVEPVVVSLPPVSLPTIPVVSLSSTPAVSNPTAPPRQPQQAQQPLQPISAPTIPLTAFAEPYSDSLRHPIQDTTQAPAVVAPGIVEPKPQVQQAAPSSRVVPAPRQAAPQTHQPQPRLPSGQQPSLQIVGQSPVSADERNHHQQLTQQSLHQQHPSHQQAGHAQQAHQQATPQPNHHHLEDDHRTASVPSRSIPLFAQQNSSTQYEAPQPTQAASRFHPQQGAAPSRGHFDSVVPSHHAQQTQTGSLPLQFDLFADSNHHLDAASSRASQQQPIGPASADTNPSPAVHRFAPPESFHNRASNDVNYSLPPNGQPREATIPHQQPVGARTMEYEIQNFQHSQTFQQYGGPASKSHISSHPLSSQFGPPGPPPPGYGAPPSSFGGRGFSPKSTTSSKSTTSQPSGGVKPPTGGPSYRGAPAGVDSPPARPERDSDMSPQAPPSSGQQPALDNILAAHAPSGGSNKRSNAASRSQQQQQGGFPPQSPPGMPYYPPGPGYPPSPSYYSQGPPPPSHYGGAPYYPAPPRGSPPPGFYYNAYDDGYGMPPLPPPMQGSFPPESGVPPAGRGPAPYYDRRYAPPPGPYHDPAHREWHKPQTPPPEDSSFGYPPYYMPPQLPTYPDPQGYPASGNAPQFQSGPFHGFPFGASDTTGSRS